MNKLFYHIRYYLVASTLLLGACSDDDGFSGVVNESAAGEYYGDVSFQSGGGTPAFGVTVEVVRIDGNTLRIAPTEGNTFTSAFEVEVGELDNQVIIRESENSNFNFFSIDMRTKPFQFAYQLVGTDELFIGLYKEDIDDLTEGLTGTYNGTLISTALSAVDVKVNVSKLSNTKVLISFADVPSIGTFEAEVQVSDLDNSVFGSTVYISNSESLIFSISQGKPVLTMQRNDPEFLFSGSME